MNDPPLLDEIEFARLCEDIVSAFEEPYVDTPNVRLNRTVPREGCFTAILGPADVPGFPVWADGRYADLSVRESRMLATIMVEKLGLIYEPDLGLHAWAEVATGRFLVSSRHDDVMPCPYPAQDSA